MVSSEMQSRKTVRASPIWRALAYAIDCALMLVLVGVLAPGLGIIGILIMAALMYGHIIPRVEADSIATSAIVVSSTVLAALLTCAISVLYTSLFE